MAATTRTWAYTTQVAVVSSGASMPSNAMSGTADISSSLTSTNHANYPYAEIAINVAMAGTVSSLSNVIMLYRRDLNIDGTNSAPAPATAAPAYSAIPVGMFFVPPVTASSVLYLSPIGGPVELVANCAFFIENKTNQTINAGWTLKATPKTDSFA